jgi:hypothetical protein
MPNKHVPRTNTPGLLAARQVVSLNKQALSFVRHGTEVGDNAVQRSRFQVPGSCSAFEFEFEVHGAEFRVRWLKPASGTGN